MEGSRLLAVSVVAAAAVALVPTFNALNEVQLVDAKPPFEIKDPPPIDPPPDFEPPPSEGPPPCEPAEETHPADFRAPGEGGEVPFTIRSGAARAGIGVRYAEYRGDSAIELVGPSGRVWSTSTSATETLLAPHSRDVGSEFDPEPGDWAIRVSNAGFVGAIHVEVVVLGCYGGAAR